MKIKFAYLVPVMLLAPVLVLSNTFYIVKKGDTLSQIAKNNSLKPIYGKSGSLKVLRELNSIKNINYLYPGQRIIIPGKTKINETRCIKTESIDITKKDVEIDKLSNNYQKKSVSYQFAGFNYSSVNSQTGGISIIPIGYNVLTYKETANFRDKITLEKEYFLNYIKTSSKDSLKTTNKNLALLGLGIGLTRYMPFYTAGVMFYVGDELYINNETTKAYIDSGKTASVRFNLRKEIIPNLELSPSIQYGKTLDLNESREIVKYGLEAKYYLDSFDGLSANVKVENITNKSEQTEDKNNSILIGIEYEF